MFKCGTWVSNCGGVLLSMLEKSAIAPLRTTLASITVSCWIKLIKGRRSPLGARRLAWMNAIRRTIMATSDPIAENMAPTTLPHLSHGENVLGR